MVNNTVVIIPTYNESENIPRLIRGINLLCMPIDILIVDDNSPDNTGDVIESMRAANPNLSILHRTQKEGLGPAYVHAFRHILKENRYDYLIQMDADLSHNPMDIPRLLESIKEYDVVVGSRYVKGGGVSDDWSIFRKYMSRCANIYARFITGLKVHDCTGGFRCYRKQALGSMDLDKNFLKGYGFQVQLLYDLKRENLMICEIPIFFSERTSGVSKMNLDIVVEAFISLILMRLGVVR